MCSSEYKVQMEGVIFAVTVMKQFSNCNVSLKKKRIWPHMELNPLPSCFQCRALPTELSEAICVGCWSVCGFYLLMQGVCIYEIIHKLQNQR